MSNHNRTKTGKAVAILFWKVCRYH